MEVCDDGCVDPFVSENEELYRREVPGLMRMAGSMVGAHDAQDVVSDAVVRVMTSDGWARVENKRAYLYRAVVNEAKMLMRSRRRRRARELLVAARSSGPRWTALPRPDVHEALDGLSVQQRAVIHLVYWEDLTIADAAILMGVSPGTAKRHLHRARERLRSVLDE